MSDVISGKLKIGTNLNLYPEKQSVCWETDIYKITKIDFKKGEIIFELIKKEDE